RVERLGAPSETAVTTYRFWAGWYAPADASSTPDTLEVSLDRPDYRTGETAQLRLIARAPGKAMVAVLSNRLVSFETVDVTEGENLIPLTVSPEWGAGAYVTASLLRPMDAASGR